MQARIEGTGNTTRRGLGVTGKLVVGGTISTGLLLGGFVVAGMTLAGRLNGGALLPTSIGLFIVGAVAGLLVSMGAGVVGREEGLSLRAAGVDAAKGALYAVPACLMGALLAGWMGMIVIGLYLGNILPVVGSLVAALVAAVIMVATFRITCEAGANAVRRVRHTA